MRAVRESGKCRKAYGHFVAQHAFVYTRTCTAAGGQPAGTTGKYIVRIEVDTHTHTTASGHAYGTLRENAQAAHERGLKGFVVSDHGPEIPGACPVFMISGVLKTVPDEIEGVRMIRGTEANIMDENGTLDVGERYLSYTQFAIASMHTLCYPPQDEEANTRAVLGAIRNPYIDVIGHPGNPKYPIDARALVEECAKLGKPVEINNHSFEGRPGSEANCRQIIRLCKEYRVPVVVSSDAHCTYTVGEFDIALRVLEEEQFPEELILNADLDRFLGYIEKRRKRIEA